MARSRSGPRLLAGVLGLGVVASCNGAVINLGPDAGSTSTQDGGVTLAPPLGAVLQTKTIDKVDILFDVDNSASMGDKQAYLQAAIPDLINRLVNPNCVDSGGASHGASGNGVCADASDHPEFTPVHDLHLGIISSSLGARGGDACGAATMALPPFQNVLAHNDDKAHLLNRTLTFANGGAAVTEGVVPDAPLPDPYLYWFPGAQNRGVTAGPGNPLSNVPATQLITDFASMVVGVGVFGCGIESQLESWYRFLVQPDPYDSVDFTTDSHGNKIGNWQGVDETIIQERADFLRPDSLVLIVDLSDENDSEIDVRSVGGLGINWMASSFDPPNGTSACATDPSSSACKSCVQGNNAQTDPACYAKPIYSAINDWGYDLNLRHVHMKAKYGVDLQFPISRYVHGLTSTMVPDRSGEYPSGAASYQGMDDCTNPLFAAHLPSSGQDSKTLCKLAPGLRTKDLVFYAHIGGVPHQLLHFTHGNPAASLLSQSDWVKILGNGLVNGTNPYDTSGIDPHMIESYQPRSGIPAPGGASNDTITYHDWITDQPVEVMGGHVHQVDLQYACMFPLVDSSGVLTSRDCTLAQNAASCDCPQLAGTVNLMQLPPICDPTTITKQVAAKAYPTIRELAVAQKLGNQGIVSSICPIDASDNATHDDPNYGYRPAVEVIVDRLKNALTNECFPQALAVTSNGTVRCELLLQIPPSSGAAAGTCVNPSCDPTKGLDRPSSDTLPAFCQGLEDEYNQAVSANGGSSAGLTDPANVPVCELNQLSPQANPMDFQGGNCAAGTDNGWCYVTGAAAGKCAHALVFTKNAIPNGAIANVICR